jgi:hypothetical protein
VERGADVNGNQLNERSPGKNERMRRGSK